MAIDRKPVPVAAVGWHLDPRHERLLRPGPPRPWSWGIFGYPGDAELLPIRFDGHHRGMGFGLAPASLGAVAGVGDIHPGSRQPAVGGTDAVS